MVIAVRGVAPIQLLDVVFSARIAFAILACPAMLVIGVLELQRHRIMRVIVILALSMPDWSNVKAVNGPAYVRLAVQKELDAMGVGLRLNKKTLSKWLAERHEHYLPVQGPFRTLFRNKR